MPMEGGLNSHSKLVRIIRLGPKRTGKSVCSPHKTLGRLGWLQASLGAGGVLAVALVGGVSRLGFPHMG